MLPLASVAVQLTVVTPNGKDEPEVGEQTMPGLGSQASLAVAVKVTIAPPPKHSAVILAGQVATGATVSLTDKLAVLLVVGPLSLLTTT